MNIAVIGSGYVGLVTGTCFAETGNNVICVDIDEKKVQSLQNGVIPIFEPGLEILFERNIKQKRLTFTTDLKSAIDNALIIFLALPTPSGEDGSADLSYVLNAANDIGKLIQDYKIIIDKSTVPVGTAEKVRNEISKNCTIDFDVISNPEFLREGVAVDDFMKPDRVVIGTKSEKAKNIMKALYEPFVRQGNPIYFMDEKSAEMAKYAANSYLATRISFMNEMAILCERLGADVDSVRIGMGSDSRIGKRFLFPGVGYGGSCFPKDVKALSKMAIEVGYEYKIIDAVMEVNTLQIQYFYKKIKNYFNNNLKNKKIAIWGLAFKPNTDDIREAPALNLIQNLLIDEASVSVYDPEAMENVEKIFGDKIRFGSDEYEILNNVDALIIMTEWNEFKNPDFELLKQKMSQKVIFDGRNVYSLENMNSHDFYYESIGRNIIKNN
jgi:UDPglucose 6-dehydrogenase